MDTSNTTYMPLRDLVDTASCMCSYALCSQKLDGMLSIFDPLVLSGMLLVAVVCLLLAVCSWARRKTTVYILDFAVFNPPDNWKFPKSMIRTVANIDGRILPEHVDFMVRLAERSGLGDETPVLPEAHLGDISLAGIEMARSEFYRCCVTTIEALFAKTGVRPSQVNIVITNSSIFNPTPSLSAEIMNRFKMGSRTRGYSLGGMGCSAGVIALDLAKELLELHPDSYALVVSHENISTASYAGKDPSMLICNCLFRCNGSAVLVTNKAQDRRRAKYRIRNIVCTNMCADDEAFNCVRLTEDDEKIVGIRLKRELIAVGEKALRQNMTALGPVVLPWSEQLAFAANYLLRQTVKSSKVLAAALPPAWLTPYVPDFKKAFEFFCIHTGGRGIIDGLEKSMQLNRQQIEPSRATLYRFGNVSSTSVWYDLAYIEGNQGISHGCRIWQLAFGSGFKFNSSMLVANRGIRDEHPAWFGFNKAAMWAELDKLEAAAVAGRAAKAARLVAEKAAAEKVAAEHMAKIAEKGAASASAAAAPPKPVVAPSEPAPPAGCTVSEIELVKAVHESGECAGAADASPCSEPSCDDDVVQVHCTVQLRKSGSVKLNVNC